MKQLFMLKEKTVEINNPADIFKNIRKINIDYSQENVLVFLLDVRCNIIKAEVLFKGGLAKCIVDPKTLFRFALINNANSIIYAHNHPSGLLNPSDDDIAIYEKLKDFGNMSTLRVLDSIIFNEKEFYSMNND